MKKCIGLALLLCLTLTAPLAVAEDVYTPGETAGALVLDALASGKMVCGDINLSVDMDSDVLELDEETAQIVDLATQVLDVAHLSGGIGLLDSGLRLTAGASLQNGQKSAGIDGALNVTSEGISIESNVIPGEKLVIDWMDLYAVLAEELGLPQDPSSIDWDAVIENLSSQLGTIGAQAATMLQPYIGIFATHAQRWDFDLQEDVPEENGYPAVDEQMTVMVTSAEMESLVREIAAYLEQDEQFSTLLEDVVAILGVTEDVYEDISILVDALNELADDFANTDMLAALTVGVSETDTFFIVELDVDDEMVALCDLLLNATDENNVAVTFDLYGVEDGYVNDQITLSMQMAGDDDAQDIYYATLLGMDGEVLSSTNASSTTKRETTDAGLPAMRTTANGISEQAADIGVVRIEENAEGVTYLTATGGEANNAEGTFHCYLDGELLFTAPLSGSWSVEPTADGVTGAAEGTASIAELGLNAFSYSATLSTADYDPATTDALKPFHLLTATQEDFDALGQRAQMGLMMRMMEIMPLLPTQVLGYIISSGL